MICPAQGWKSTHNDMKVNRFAINYKKKLILNGTAEGNEKLLNDIFFGRRNLFTRIIFGWNIQRCKKIDYLNYDWLKLKGQNLNLKNTTTAFVFLEDTDYMNFIRSMGGQNMPIFNVANVLKGLVCLGTYFTAFAILGIPTTWIAALAAFASTFLTEPVVRPFFAAYFAPILISRFIENAEWLGKFAERALNSINSTAPFMQSLLTVQRLPAIATAILIGIWAAAELWLRKSEWKKMGEDMLKLINIGEEGRWKVSEKNFLPVVFNINRWEWDKN